MVLRYVVNILSRLCPKRIERRVFFCDTTVLKEEGTMTGREMYVVEIQTADHHKRYVVVDEKGSLVEPIVRYLKYLDRIGAARNTLRSYASALKLYWHYLLQQELDWQQVTLDDLAQFVLWLKLPSGSLKVLPAHPVAQARSNRTI